MDEQTDWELVALAQKGDMEAYGRLVRRYQSPVIHFCFRMIGSREDAEDLAQECFVRVYRYLAKMKPSAKFTTFMFGVARNLALNHLRDSGRRGRGTTQSLTAEDESERALLDNEHRPDKLARLEEISALLERALALLTPEHREVIVLREIQGMDYQAIAEILKCRRGTVKSRLARAREQLRQRVIELGGEQL